MKKIIISIFCLLMLLTISGCNNNNENTAYEMDKELFDKAEQLYMNQKYTEAYEIFLPEAEKGSIKAKYFVGAINYDGEIENADEELGIKYMQEALDAGYDRAYLGMGRVYRKGNEALGIEQDNEKALEYYQKAIDAGYAGGYHNMALLYVAEGEYDKAVEYFEKAIDMGFIESYSCLGNFYFNYTDEYEKVFENWIKAAENGMAVCVNNVGYLYEVGLGVEQNAEKAIEYYQKAADMGEPYGYESLGDMYRYGTCVDVDYDKAIEYYQLAIDNGSKDAQQYLDELLEEINNQQ